MVLAGTIWRIHLEEAQCSTALSQGPAVPRSGHAEPAIPMLHQDRAEPADFIVQTSNSLLQPLVLHRELLDLLLELAKPRLLALSTLERGCGLALLILPPLMLMLTLPVPLKEVLALVLLRLGLAVVAGLVVAHVVVAIKVG